MADAGDLYDEFGNYIGPELSESEEVRACFVQRVHARILAAPCCSLAHLQQGTLQGRPARVPSRGLLPCWGRSESRTRQLRSAQLLLAPASFLPPH